MIKNVLARILAHLTVDPETGCWRTLPSMPRSPRLLILEAQGFVPPPGLAVDVTCDTPECCNPDHAVLRSREAARQVRIDRAARQWGQDQRKAAVAALARGVTSRTIADEAGVPVAWVYALRRKALGSTGRSRSIHPAKAARIRELYRQGVDYRTIAEEVGVSPHTVWRYGREEPERRHVARRFVYRLGDEDVSRIKRLYNAAIPVQDIERVCFVSSMTVYRHTKDLERRRVS